MKIHLIRSKATTEQITDMLQAFDDFIKLAVDVEREVLAGGSSLHAECESVLLEDGSKQENIWGADWLPNEAEVRFRALINIRPSQNNPSMMILNPALCDQVERIARRLLEHP